MAWRRCISFAKKNSVALSGFLVAGSIVLYDRYKEDGKVFASWTTNFEPSVKWDYNWDRYRYME
jgi:hypothetical protein